MDSHTYADLVILFDTDVTHIHGHQVYMYFFLNILFDILTDDLLLKPPQPCTGLF